MDLDSSPSTIFETHEAGSDLPDTQQSTLVDLHSPTHEVIGEILPETTHSTLVVDDRSTDIKISLVTGMITKTTGTAVPEPR